MPVSEEAPFALTDAERLIEAIERCADSLGVPRTRVAQSAAQLAEGYRLNQATMLQPEFAERLLRAPRAQQVLQRADHGDALAAARSTKAGNDQARLAERIAAQQRAAERMRAADAEAAARAQAAAVLAHRAPDKVQAAEAVWRGNPSAPGPGDRICENDLTTTYAGRSRDVAWVAMVEQEIGQCTRISSRRDANCFNGLALGTSVTDEQLAHAVGRTLTCLSDSQSKRLLDGLNRVSDALFAKLGVAERQRAMAELADNYRSATAQCDRLRQELGAAQAAQADQALHITDLEGQLDASDPDGRFKAIGRTLARVDEQGRANFLALEEIAQNVRRIEIRAGQTARTGTAHAGVTRTGGLSNDLTSSASAPSSAGMSRSPAQVRRSVKPYEAGMSAAFYPYRWVLVGLTVLTLVPLGCIIYRVTRPDPTAPASEAVPAATPHEDEPAYEVGNDNQPIGENPGRQGYQPGTRSEASEVAPLVNQSAVSRP